MQQTSSNIARRLSLWLHMAVRVIGPDRGIQHHELWHSAERAHGNDTPRGNGFLPRSIELNIDRLPYESPVDPVKCVKVHQNLKTSD